MDLAALDFPVARRGVRALRFDAPAPLGPAELIVWEPGTAARHWADIAEATDGARPILAVRDAQALLALTRHWRGELRAALRDGAALAVFLPRGAGFGVHTLQEVVGFDLLEALPDGAPARAPESPPAAVRCVTGEPFAAFFSEAGGLLAAESTLREPPGRALCVAAGSGSVAGAYAYRHPGHLLLLPAPRAGLLEDERVRLCDALVDLARRLRRSGRPGPLQSWAQDYALPGEEVLRAEIAGLDARRREADAALARARAQLETLDLAKQLVAGYAAGAVRAAAHALHALGAYAQPGMDDAETIAFEHRGRFAVALLVTDPDDTGAVRRAAERAAVLDAAAAAPARALLLYCAENHCPPGERRGPLPALRAAADAASVAIVTADELLKAYLAGDPGVLDRLIAGASPRR